MAESIADLRAKLADANTVTNEIAADVADLVARAGQATDPADIAAANQEAADLVTRLKAVAATHTPA